MSAWLRTGGSVEAFWRLTPRTLRLALQAHSERLDREHRQGAWIAWHTAALGRVKRMPKLEELIGGKVHAAVQSAEQMKSVFAAMRARAAET